jgi:hypothetical protein
MLALPNKNEKLSIIDLVDNAIVSNANTISRIVVFHLHNAIGTRIFRKRFDSCFNPIAQILIQLGHLSFFGLFSGQ